MNFRVAGCLLPHTDPHNTPDFKNGNLTFVSATLGRTATFKCVAKNLVGQKTVTTFFYFGPATDSFIDRVRLKYHQL